MFVTIYRNNAAGECHCNYL